MSSQQLVTCAGCGVKFPPSKWQRVDLRAGNIKRAFCSKDCYHGNSFRPVAAKVNNPEPAAAPETPPAVVFTHYDDAWQALRKRIGMSRDRYAGPSKKKAATGLSRVLVVSDPHNPFMEADAFADALTAGADCDTCVCLGDVFDAYSFSTFRQYERVDFAQELAAATVFIQTLSERFAQVYILEGGNHDARLPKRLFERCNQDMIDAICYMTGGTLNPLVALCNRFENVKCVSHRLEDGGTVPWFWQMGDAVFSHAEKYSRVPASAMRSVDEWFDDYRQTTGIDDYRVVFQGHTHGHGLNAWRSDRLLVEVPCLSQTHEYQLSSRVMGRPQRRGWVTFEQHDGVTDLNSVRTFWWDVRRVRDGSAA